MLQDTIAAVATAPGDGGIAVIRISGPGSSAIASRVFRPKSGRNVICLAGYTVSYGVVTEGNGADTIDDALLTMFRAPRSYTGEDVCEIACHGGSATTGAVLDLVLNAGARVALPGEFTQRAFLNGRMDLAQAEAVADIIRARTESARRLARRQLEGDVSRAAAAIRNELIGIVAAIEVTIDFSDEVGDLVHSEIIDGLDRVIFSIEHLISSAGKGRIMRDGLSVAIVGRPNVGKSTLLNAMLKCDRAIVTPVPGTTRDTIEERVEIRGLPVVLTDTAGIRETEDVVEHIGVERSKQVLATADVCLLVIDAASGVTPDDFAGAHLIRVGRSACVRDPLRGAMEGSAAFGCECIVVCNKCDMVDAPSLDRLVRVAPELLGLPGVRAVCVSATNGIGVEQLEDALAAPYLSRDDVSHVSSADPIASVVVSNARHSRALEAAQVCITHARQSARDMMPGDFIALDIRGALDALGHITGDTVTEDIIHRIFSDFCVGK